MSPHMHHAAGGGLRAVAAMLHHLNRLQRSPTLTRTAQRLTQLNSKTQRKTIILIRNMATQAAADVGSSGQEQQQPAAAEDPIVQWLVLRRDLWTDVGWPLGPVIAQACHASSAAMFTHLDDPLTQQYISGENIDHMHKVVLEVKSEQQLVNFSKKLEQEGILHKLWIEQPENYPTCLATKPYRKSQAAALFKKLQLCKAALAK